MIIGKNIERSNVVGDLEGKEYMPVTRDGLVTTATGQNFYGIVLQGNASPVPSEVAVHGEIIAYAAEAISKDDPITGGANGVAKARLTVSTSGAVTAYDVVRGFAMEDIAAGSKGKIYLY